MKKLLFVVVALAMVISAITAALIIQAPSYQNIEASDPTPAYNVSLFILKDIKTALAFDAGQTVGNVGNGPANYFQLNNISVPTTGTYNLTIYYISGESRPANMSINGGAATSISFPTTCTWGNIEPINLTATLNAGNNTIRFSNNIAYAPDFDRIVVSNSTVSTSYEAESSGTTLAGGCRIQNVSAASGGPVTYLHNVTLTDQEVANIRNLANITATDITQWSDGYCTIHFNIIEIAQIDNMTATDSGNNCYWLSPRDVRETIYDKIPAHTDFIIVTHSAENFSLCWGGLTVGTATCEAHLDGRAYAWCPWFRGDQSAAFEHELIHQIQHGLYTAGFEDSIKCDNVINSSYNTTGLDPHSYFSFLDCADRDPLFEAYQLGFYRNWGGYCDYVRSNCSNRSSCNGGTIYNQFMMEEHFPKDLQLITSHCCDGIQNYGETSVDKGGPDCPKATTLSITASPIEGGDTSASYDCPSAIVTINANANSCYRFVNWTGSGVDAGKVADTNSASTTINMTDNYSVQANFAPSYNNWNYHQIFTVNGSPDGSLSNYQLKLTVYKGNGTSTGSNVYLNDHCNNDFSDIRFIKSDGATALNYWIENFSSGNTATVWIKLDSIPASPISTSFYLYYGNPSATGNQTAYDSFWGITNGDFETGNYTGWAVNVTGTQVFGVSSDAWTLKHATYFSNMESSAACSNGKYGRIYQTVNLTNVKKVRFQLGARLYGERSQINVYIDNTSVYARTMSGSTSYPDQEADVSNFSGIHTLEFRNTKVAGDWPGGFRLDKVMLRNYTVHEPTFNSWRSETAY